MDFFFHPQQRRYFFPLSSVGGPLSSLSFSLDSIYSGDFGAFLGSEIFLTFFPAFVVVFFPSLDVFLGFCPSSLGSSINPNTFLDSSDLNDFHAFLGCRTFLALLLHLLRRLIIIHFIHMIFLISLQCLFMSLFLFFVKLFILFRLLLAGFNLFHSFGMIALALETGTPFNSFLVFRVS